MPPSKVNTNDRGLHGEQAMGFHLGEQGYVFYDGPSGAGGHKANEHGFDGVAYHPDLDHMILLDNKSVARPGKVSNASSVDAEKNLVASIDRAAGRIRGIQGAPGQDRILKLLAQARDAATGAGGRWPENVTVAVSNAGGRASGLSPRLAAQNIKFIDYYAAPRSAPSGGPAGRPGSVDRPKIGGDGLGALIQGAHIYIRNGLTKISQEEALREAHREYTAREPEVQKLLLANPGLGVRVDFYFEVIPGPNPDAHTEQVFIGMTFSPSPGPPTPYLYEPHPRGQLVHDTAFFAPDPRAKRKPRGQPEDHLPLVHDELKAGNYQKAYEKLNGCSMPDMLRVLGAIKKKGLFEAFAGKFAGSAAGVNRGRILVALTAVRKKGRFTGLSELLADPATGDPFRQLPDDQQQTVRAYLSSP